ncbi:hypothetical protein BCK_27268 (plasmid) [Bacillus cereus FRI-35]|uniref:hypothetical protein n=1 Tax=Bacillus paranthracis TaxID=2026186 RepID=UPI00027CD6F8|nr:hypothetical protein [Bacillus paranthracis]AFQ13263.1 hypothetical protein BCK_27268 [Bacillus cereus FRI-35]MCR6464988.1 hypothetical protein [Bacillus paranthracis]MCR9021472.1 hypothetical protein [Bacillus paranthracis]
MPGGLGGLGRIRGCQITHTCGLDPRKKIEENINNLEKNIKNLANNAAENAIGESGKALLSKIEEVKQVLKDITDPEKMLKEWLEKILETTEDATMDFVKDGIKQYEIPNVYQLTPFVRLEVNNTTLNIRIIIFISHPNVDLNHVKDEKKLTESSYGDFVITSSLDILKPNISDLNKSIKSAKFEFRDTAIKDQIISQFKDNEGEILAGIITNQFAEYLNVFKKLQEMSGLFKF